MRWRRFRKWAKWACTVAAGAAVGLAVLTRFFSASVEHSNGGGKEWFGSACTGRLWIGEYRDVPPHSRWLGWRWDFGRYEGWDWSMRPDLPTESAMDEWHLGVLCPRDRFGTFVGVSVIHPALFTSVVAGLLWYAGRRRFGPGRCAKCGYDRHGLAADAKCPECGAVPFE